MSVVFRYPILWLCVGVPTFLAIVYFGFFASDDYVSEASFVVRSAQRPEGAVGLGDLFKGLGSAGSESAWLVREYLLSPELMVDLDDQLNLRSHYGQGDFLSRFPSFFILDSRSEFLSYYKSRVMVEVDPASSVALLTVHGFTPGFVKTLATALLLKAQERVRSLNQQIRQDALELAEQELLLATRRLHVADAAIASYRISQGILDPERQAALALQSEQDINARRLAAQARLAQTRSVAPHSAMVTALEAEIDIFQRASNSVRGEVVGQAARSHVRLSEAYQSRQLERDIAVRMVGAANEALLRARVDTERRHLYIETLSRPSAPDGALEPRRLRSVMAIAVLGLFVAAIFSLLLAGIREHRQDL